MTLDDVVMALDQHSSLILAVGYVVAFGLGFIGGQQR